ncbi:MAG TPA: hypothetical protein VK133_01075 [Amoebophilaceae bacterium]|jgi:glutathione peroxidase|nr:hypothetical protein [Amoebophilaceae bacterium]
MKTNHTHTVEPFRFTCLNGSTFELDGSQVVLVVNTASQCGLAKQLPALQTLHERYHSQGFTVLGVSSQSFRKQEFEEICAIEAALQKKGGNITFPVTQLEAVRGRDIHPFYAWAAAQVSFLGRPKWNFHKYLVGRGNNLINWFASTTDPLHPNILEAIENAL